MGTTRHAAPGPRGQRRIGFHTVTRRRARGRAGTVLALPRATMTTALELVYRYRQLAGKCDTCGLTMDEIDLMTTIESLFRGGGADGRRFSREPVSLTATLRGRGHSDVVTVDNLAPGGLVCQRAPYYATDDTVDVVIDDDECGLSYRFKARVTWVRADADTDDYVVGLAFVGAPVLLRYAPARAAANRVGMADAA
ncbi:MAG: hypothetical protein D6689_08735 [Deltaproteobacteria bacterium]|nr:MAG: hypothetical protein D6689_08735 [Deltaproteobacteria bacterium]